MFKVRASNNDQVWNKKGIRIHLIIHPPWWRTWWFYLLCVAAFSSLIYLSLRIYTNRKLEKQRVILEKKQAIQLERLRISSELHDDVGGELSTIRLLSEMNVSNTNSQQQLSKISSSSGELVKKMNEIVWALNMNNDTLQSLLAYIRSYAVKYLDDVGIDCHFEQPEIIPDFAVDGNSRRNIFLLLKEALNNVVKHAQANEVTICVAILDDLQITIHDNGKGISLDGTENGSGNGFYNMQRRIKELKGCLELKNQRGTTLIFRLPVFKK